MLRLVLRLRMVGFTSLFVVLQAGVSVLLLYETPRFVQRVRGTAERRGERRVRQAGEA